MAGTLPTVRSVECVERIIHNSAPHLKAGVTLSDDRGYTAYLRLSDDRLVTHAVTTGQKVAVKEAIEARIVEAIRRRWAACTPQHA